jgi:hypothetical protein
MFKPTLPTPLPRRARQGIVPTQRRGVVFFPEYVCAVENGVAEGGVGCVFR